MLKFLSLLGTGSYIPSNYYLEATKSDDCCFIQRAILEILEKKDVIPNEVVIFTTKDALIENWEKNKFDNTRSGLKDELEEYSKRTNSKINVVSIPAGHNEEELWELFEIILGELGNDDEIILDITHSFRYLPMLTFIVINYARIIKGCKVNAIYYGAFETLGDQFTVKNMDLKDRNAPVFDLTSFVQLFDWTIGVDRYLSTGDVSAIEELAKSEIKKINEAINKQIISSKSSENPALLFKDPKTLRDLSNSMRQYSEVVFTCRGKEITSAVASLKRDIDNVLKSTAHSKIKPLVPVIDMLLEKFERFSFDDELINVIETTKWCLNNGMYQQGFTILEEGLISYICEKWALDKIEKRNRDWVTRYAHMVVNSNINPAHTLLGMEEKEAKDLFALLYNIGDKRNDINHVGMRHNAAAAHTFREELAQLIERVESIFYKSTHYEKTEDEIVEKQMLLIFSHELTENQKKEAIEKFGVVKFVSMDNTLLNKWANVPPQLDSLSEYLSDVVAWIEKTAQPGDYALVQGDFGATMFVVDFCMSRDIIPVYATTERKVVEKKTGETIKLSREFEHVQFRKYQLVK